MANIKSAKKRILTAQKRTEANKAQKTDLKTAIKKAKVAISENSADKAALVQVAISKIDKAEKNGILHMNNASRKKSALASGLNVSN